METDRGAVLTVRAAVRGAIDFRQAQILDVRWWRMVNTILRAMARDDEVVVERAIYDYQLALVGNPRLEDEGFKKVQQTAREHFHGLFNLVRPWAAQTLSEVKKGEVDTLISDYKKVFGDPNDPEFRRKLDQDIAASRARRAAAKAAGESEEQRINRLMTARDRKLKLAQNR